MDLLRYLAQLGGSLLFAFGAANALVRGLWAGSFSGRRGATFPLHGAPIKFLAIAVFLTAVSAFFAYLAYLVYSRGLEGSRRDAELQREARYRQHRQHQAAARASQVPTRVGAALLVLCVGMVWVAKQPWAGFAGLLALLGALATGVGAVIAFSQSGNPFISRIAQGLLVLVVLAALLFK